MDVCGATDMDALSNELLVMIVRFTPRLMRPQLALVSGLWHAVAQRMHGGRCKSNPQVCLAVYAERLVGARMWHLLDHLGHEVTERVGAGACNAAARDGDLARLKNMARRGYGWNATTMVSAAEQGHLHVIEWLHKRGCPIAHGIAARASFYGHQHILEYLWRFPHEGEPMVCAGAASRGDMVILKALLARGYSWEESTCVAAAAGGHLEVLQWAVGQGCPCNEKRTAAKAASRGHLPILEWMRSRGSLVRIYGVREKAVKHGHVDIVAWAHGISPTADPSLAAMAARHGHLHILEWMLAQRYDFDEDACAAAVRGGHLGILQWLRSVGCPWNAILLDRIDILEWAHANGCPWPPTVPALSSGETATDASIAWSLAHGRPMDDDALEWAGRTGRLRLLQQHPLMVTSHVCTEAAHNGHLHILQWVHAHMPGLIDEATMEAAAGCGRQRVVEWLRSVGCPWGANTLWRAASGNHTDVFAWAQQNGCPPDNRIYDMAARKGNLPLLQLIRGDRDYGWQDSVARTAANLGYLDIVQWIHAECIDRVHDDRYLCVEAARGGHLPVLQWMRANGYEWGPEVVYGAARTGHLHVIMWAVENGCPWDIWSMTLDLSTREHVRAWVMRVRRRLVARSSRSTILPNAE